MDALLEKSDDEAFPYAFTEKKKLGMLIFDAANPALKKPII